MKESETIEGNKLIADFMGFKPYEDGRYGIMWPDPSRTGNPVVMGNRYHKSWDWLMPVVEKISLTNSVNIHQSLPSKWVDIHATRHRGSHVIISINHDDLIAATWLAVVEFIKWFNSNKTVSKELK